MWTDRLPLIPAMGKRRDALRMAIQSALAATGAWTAILLLGTGEAFLGVISAVFVLQTNRDETIGSAESRIMGTVVGTLVGLAALALTLRAPAGVSLALTMMIMAPLAIYRPGWRYGIVAAAGLAIGSDAGFWETAQNRGLAIFVGAGIGTLVGAVVWPESARARARRRIGEALALCRELLDDSLASAIGERDPGDDNLRARFADTLTAAGEAARSIKIGGAGLEARYEDAVHRIERLWHALVIIDRVTEARSGGRLPFRDETRATIERLRTTTCDALRRAEAIERIDPDDLDALDRGCREVWRDADVDPARDDELQSVALVFGLGEVARNLREIDQAICAIGAAR